MSEIQPTYRVRVGGKWVTVTLDEYVAAAARNALRTLRPTMTLLSTSPCTNATRPIGYEGQIVYVVDTSWWDRWSEEEHRWIPLTKEEAIKIAVTNHEDFGRWVAAMCEEFSIEVSHVQQALEDFAEKHFDHSAPGKRSAEHSEESDER